MNWLCSLSGVPLVEGEEVLILILSSFWIKDTPYAVLKDLDTYENVVSLFPSFTFKKVIHTELFDSSVKQPYESCYLIPFSNLEILIGKEKADKLRIEFNPCSTSQVEAIKKIFKTCLESNIDIKQSSFVQCSKKQINIGLNLNTNSLLLLKKVISK